MKKETIFRRTLAAVFTAIVVVLQLLGSFIHFGPFSISLVLIPIVVGSALGGPLVGGWLGLAFGAAVFLSGDAALFFAIDPFGTIATVLMKGMLAGLCAGLVYSALQKKNALLAVVSSAVVAPIVNTGVFLIGCLLFFMPTVTEWSTGFGFPSVGNYMIFGLVGGNFLFELLVNIILSPVILRLIKTARKRLGRNA